MLSLFKEVLHRVVVRSVHPRGRSLLFTGTVLMSLLFVAWWDIFSRIVGATQALH